MREHKLCLIGGGHGLSRILAGLINFTYLSALVGVTDTGGSTGKLRNVFNCPAMGDIRLCLSTLGDPNTKPLMEKRIKDYKDCVGNLVISSLIKLYDFDVAIKIAHKLFGLKETHNIIPISLDNFHIKGKYFNGKLIEKETDFICSEKIETIWLEPKATPNKEAIEAIKSSDYIILAPGSFYTSILVNLLIPQIAEEINKKKIIWIVNAMQQLGETVGMDIEEHANKLLEYIDHIDYALINTTKPSEEILKENYEGFLMPLNYLQKNPKIKNIIEKDFIKYSENEIVHSPTKVIRVIKEIMRENK